MNKLTPEQQKDVEERIELFKKDFLAIVDKYEMDFVCYPQYIQNSEGQFSTVAQMTLMDKRYMNPSPLKKEDIIK